MMKSFHQCWLLGAASDNFSDSLKETFWQPWQLQSVTHQVCEGKKSMRDLNFSLCSSLHTRTVPEFRVGTSGMAAFVHLRYEMLFSHFHTFKVLQFFWGGEDASKEVWYFFLPPSKTLQIQFNGKSIERGLWMKVSVEIHNKRLLQAPGCKLHQKERNLNRACAERSRSLKPAVRQGRNQNDPAENSLKPSQKCAVTPWLAVRGMPPAALNR